VNNGGDIALALGHGARFAIGIVADPRDGRVVGRLTIGHGDGIGGIATSGRHGRSLSLGIADAVTVLAADAAAADAAATLIANAVDLPGSAKVHRVPAQAVACDSDLGDRLVTAGVDPLSADEADRALARGADAARAMLARGLIAGAALCLDRRVATVGGEGRFVPDAPQLH
ncbi:MAG: UPF0280 family protein, partial [Alphaproteobacteria bacterium]